MVYRKKSNCQKSASHLGQNCNYDFANLSSFKAAFEPSFSVWISEKQSSPNGDNRAAPLMGRRQPARVSCCGQSPFGLHCFLEIQIKKITHSRCLERVFKCKKTRF